MINAVVRAEVSIHFDRIEELAILTRDTRRFAMYFPRTKLIAPGLEAGT